MRQEIVETDVLCIGGGIAGLMAAIRASELGAKITVAEKANTLRSGSGATGNDHFMCYLPEIHGPDIAPIIQEARRSPLASMRSRTFVRTWMEQSSHIVGLWDSWGIPMRHQGEYEFAGHGFPGRPLIFLKYAGQEQKPVLTREARNRGTEIMNRVMVFDLLLNGSDIVGAIGIDTREDKVIVFQAKSVILATGTSSRLYPSPTPGWMFNLSDPPCNTGAGRAMAYRAGAELADMEIPYRHAGPKYLARCGKATWIGVLRDPQGKPVGPFVTKPEKRYGDIAADIYTTMFEDYAKSGRGPVYMDCGGIADDDFNYMMYWMGHEGNSALINYLTEESINPRKNPIEFTTYNMVPAGGVYFNEKGETSLKGLYAAGDEIHGGISGAAIFGWIAGENAASYSKGNNGQSVEVVKAKVDQKTALLSKIRSRTSGASWKEANIALQHIMYDYAGSVRSETLLQAGLSYLRRLREKVLTTLIAADQHDIMHCLEVLDLLDIGEVIFYTALERKETRGRHIRPDYPFTNPLLSGKLLFIKKVNDKPVTEWREVRR